MGSNLVANLGGTVDDGLKKGCCQSSKERVAPIRMTYLDNWNMSNSPNSGPNIWNSSSVGQDSTIQEDLRVGLSLLPLGNHGLLSSSWSSNQGESGKGESGIGDMSGQGETSGVSSMVGQRVGGV